MALPGELTSAVRALDEHELRRLLILVRGLLVGADGPMGPVDAQGEPLHVTYRQERRRCSAEGCDGCPHGPYWYGVWREDGRTRRQYVGRTLPGEELPRVEPGDGVRRSGGRA